MLYVKGYVEGVEFNQGTIPGQGMQPAVDWRTCHVEVGGERIKFRIPQTGEMPVPVPAEGDHVEIGVAIGLKQQSNDLLHPFVLVLTARSCTVIESAAEAAAAREERSLTSAPSRGPRRAAAAAAS